MIFSLRPVFIGWITLLYQLPLQLFFTLWVGGFFGGLFKATRIFPGDSWTPFVFCGALAFFGTPLVTYVGKKLNYARTEYRIFPDRLEFEEGFFTINQKVIKFRDVKEVTFSNEYMGLAASILRHWRPAPLPAPMCLLLSGLEMYLPAALEYAIFQILTRHSRK